VAQQLSNMLLTHCATPDQPEFTEDIPGTHPRTSWLFVFARSAVKSAGQSSEPRRISSHSGTVFHHGLNGHTRASKMIGKI